MNSNTSRSRKYAIWWYHTIFYQPKKYYDERGKASLTNDRRERAKNFFPECALPTNLFVADSVVLSGIDQIHSSPMHSVIISKEKARKPILFDLDNFCKNVKYFVPANWAFGQYSCEAYKEKNLKKKTLAFKWHIWLWKMFWAYKTNKKNCMQVICDPKSNRYHLPLHLPLLGSQTMARSEVHATPVRWNLEREFSN